MEPNDIMATFHERGQTLPSPEIRSSPRYVVIDVETTGLSPKRDRILEIAAVTLMPDGRVVHTWVTRVNPETSVGATHIHGITASDVRDAPVFAAIIKDVNQILAGAALVAHNAAFDLGFLQAEYRRAGWVFPDVPYVCTMQASRHYLPALNQRRLADCCGAYGISNEHAHSALSDAVATSSLLSRYLDLSIPPRPRVDETVVVQQAFFVRWPLGQETLSTWTQPSAAQRNLVSQLVNKDVDAVIESIRKSSAPPYFQALLRTLNDCELDEEESLALDDLVSQMGYDQATVDAVHAEFLTAMVVQALIDNKMTPAEKSQIVTIGALLGRSRDDVLALIEHLCDAKKRYLASLTRALPPEWWHGDPLRIGDRVAFSGCGELRELMEARARAAGLEVAGQISKKTKLLISDGSVNGAKDRNAKEYGIRVVSPEDGNVLISYVQPPE